jgi:hypothetical protein
MAGITTHTADDIVGIILALGTVILAVSNLATVLASLVLVVTESTVQSSKFSKLVSLELVLTFRNRGSLRE